MFTLSPDEWSAVALSLKVASAATLASLPFGAASVLLYRMALALQRPEAI